MMSGPARYLGRIPEVGGLPRRATAFYDGELFALTYRRIFLGNFPASSLTQSLRKFVIIAGLRDVRPLASLHPSNSSPPPTVDTWTAASSTVLTASSLLTYRSTISEPLLFEPGVKYTVGATVSQWGGMTCPPPPPPSSSSPHQLQRLRELRWTWTDSRNGANKHRGHRFRLFWFFFSSAAPPRSSTLVFGRRRTHTLWHVQWSGAAELAS